MFTKKAEQMRPGAEPESQVGSVCGPVSLLTVTISYARDETKKVWTGRVVEHQELCERGLSVRRVRSQLKRAVKRLYGREVQIDEIVELPEALEAEVSAFAGRQMKASAERSELMDERIRLAKQMLRWGVPQCTAATKLLVSNQTLGKMLMQEATGKRPPVRALAVESGMAGQ